LIGTTKRREVCQVGSATEHPCLHRAMVEIGGVPFCATCAREQEAYFAVGRRVARALAHAQEGQEPDWEGVGMGTRRAPRRSGRALWAPYVGGGMRVGDRRGLRTTPPGEERS
jgi:hypothetical protein